MLAIRLYVHRFDIADTPSWKRIDRLLISSGIFQDKRKYSACDLKCRYCVFTLWKDLVWCIRTHDSKYGLGNSNFLKCFKLNETCCLLTASILLSGTLPLKCWWNRALYVLFQCCWMNTVQRCMQNLTIWSQIQHKRLQSVHSPVTISWYFTGLFHTKFKEKQCRDCKLYRQKVLSNQSCIYT